MRTRYQFAPAVYLRPQVRIEFLRTVTLRLGAQRQ
jgi:hypothetical protein